MERSPDDPFRQRKLFEDEGKRGCGGVDFVEIFPDELVLEVFSWLSPWELRLSSCVCRSWHRLSCDTVLWQRVCLLYWREQLRPPIAPHVKRELSGDWKQNFRILRKEHFLRRKPLVMETFAADDEEVAVTCVQFDDQMVVSGHENGTMKIFDRESRSVLRSVRAHHSAIRNLVLRGDVIVSGSRDHVVKIWDRRGVCIHTFQLPGPVESFSCYGSRLLVGCHVVPHDFPTPPEPFSVWDLDSKELLKAWGVDRHNCVPRIAHVRMQSESIVLTAAQEDRCVRMWDVFPDLELYEVAGRNHFVLEDSGVMRLHEFHGSGGSPMMIQTDDTHIVVAFDDGVIKAWDIVTGSALRAFVHESIVSCFTFHDFLLVVGCQDQHIYIWDLENGALINRVNSSPTTRNPHMLLLGSIDSTPRSVAFDRRMLLVGRERLVMWDSKMIDALAEYSFSARRMGVDAIELQNAAKLRKNRVKGMKGVNNVLSGSELASILNSDILSALTDEVCIKILRHLGCSDLGMVAMVSREWNRLAEDDRLWKPLVLNDWKRKISACRPIRTQTVQFSPNISLLSGDGSSPGTSPGLFPRSPQPTEITGRSPPSLVLGPGALDCTNVPFHFGSRSSSPPSTILLNHGDFDPTVLQDKSSWPRSRKKAKEKKRSRRRRTFEVLPEDGDSLRALYLSRTGIPLASPVFHHPLQGSLQSTRRIRDVSASTSSASSLDGFDVYYSPALGDIVSNWKQSYRRLRKAHFLKRDLQQFLFAPKNDDGPPTCLLLEAGKVFVGSASGFLRVYSAETSLSLCGCKAHGSVVASVRAFHLNVLTCSEDHTLKHWRLTVSIGPRVLERRHSFGEADVGNEGGERHRRLSFHIGRARHRHESEEVGEQKYRIDLVHSFNLRSSVSCIRILRPPLVVLGTASTMMAVWESITGEAAAGDFPVKIYNIDTKKKVKAFGKNLKGGVSCLDANRSDVFVGSYGDRTVRQYSMKSGAIVREFTGHKGIVTCLQVDLNWLVSGSEDGTVRLWDIESGSCLRILKQSSAVLSLRVREHILVVSSRDSVIAIWDVESGSLHQRFSIPKPSKRATHISLAFNDRALFVASKNGILKYIHHLRLQVQEDQSSMAHHGTPMPMEGAEVLS